MGLPYSLPIISYYVSTSGTGDGLTSAAPMSVADFEALTLRQDTNVYLKCGDTFDFSYTITKDRINFREFGSGAAPIVRGSIDIASQDWTDDGSNIFYTVMAEVPKTVFIDGVEAKKAETAWILITNRVASTTVTADATTLNNLNSTESLIGAEFVAKTLYWHPSYSFTVTGYAAGVLTFASKVGQVINVTNSGGKNLYPNAGMGFKLRNKKSFITDVGDWSYDSATQRLYVKTAGSAPTGIRACVENYGIDIAETVQNVTIQNIEFTQQYLEGVRSMNNKNVTVNNCQFHDIHQNGISARKDSDNVDILNCTVYNCAGTGINIGRVTNSTIIGNTVYDIGLQTWVCPEHYSYAIRDFYIGGAQVDQILTLGVGIGIHVGYDVEAKISVPETLTISGNTVDSVGYLGIGFVGRSVTVSNNVISDFCRTWNDCGGIYCINRPFGHGYGTTNCTIQGNIVRDGLGTARSLEGTDLFVKHAEGIYIDNGCTLITVDGNTVTNCSEFGILVSWDTYQVTVTDNTVLGLSTANTNSLIGFRSYNQWVGYQGVKARYGNSVKHTYTGNIVVNRDPDAFCIEAYSGDNNVGYNPFHDSGTADNNHYVNPYTTIIGKHDATSVVTYPLSGVSPNWRERTSAEASSTAYVNWLTYSSEANAAIEVKIEINETDAAVQFNIPSGYTDVYGNAPSNPYTIAAYSSLIYLKETEA